MKKPITSIQGLSLIELLVALTILSIIAVLCVQTSRHMLRHSAQWTTHLQQTQRTQNARQMIADDIHNLTNTQDDHQTLHGLTLAHGALQLVRSHWPEQYINPHHTGLITVHYALEDGCLMRSHTPYMHEADGSEYHSCLLDDSHTLTISIMDQYGLWHHSWPSPHAKKLQARAIRITSNHGPTPFETTVSIELGQSYAKGQTNR